MSDNTFDPKHPHEPEIPPHFDADGRCLICVMICKRDRAIRERDEAIKQIHEEARDYELQIKKLCEAYNDLGEQNAKLREIAERAVKNIREARNLSVIGDWREIDIIHEKLRSELDQLK
jgi:hypothetical protein